MNEFGDTVSKIFSFLDPRRKEIEKAKRQLRGKNPEELIKHSQGQRRIQEVADGIRGAERLTYQAGVETDAVREILEE
jgi:hypothetical protein